MARGIFPVDGQASLILPDSLLLDTTFVVETLLAGQTYSGVCSAFLSQAAEAGTLIAFSRLLEIELAQVAFKVAIKERHGSARVRQLRHDGRVRRRAARLMAEAMESWRLLLDGFRWVSLDLGDVVDEVPRLMKDHALESYDAAHVATGRALGIGSIATLDNGFASVPESELDIFTVQARTRTMRRRRGGAQG